MRHLSIRLEQLERRLGGKQQDNSESGFSGVDTEACALACAAVEAQARGDQESMDRLSRELRARLESLQAGAARPPVTAEALLLMVQRESGNREVQSE